MFTRTSSAISIAFLALATLAAPSPLRSQVVALRFVAIDMQGGAVLPSESEPGVAFGARLGLLELLGRWLKVGPELSWWTADRNDADLEHRDIVTGLAFWKGLGRGSVHPFLGLSAALHSVDVTGPGGGEVAPDAAALAESLDGYRFGAGGFVGLALRLTQTGAIWLVAEYRYTAVTHVSHHEIRGGVRVAGSGR